MTTTPLPADAPARLPVSLWLMRPAAADEAGRLAELAALCREVVAVSAEVPAETWQARLAASETGWLLPVEGALPDVALVEALHRRAGAGIGRVAAEPAAGEAGEGHGLYACAALRHCLAALAPAADWAAFLRRAAPVLRLRALHPPSGPDALAGRGAAGRACWIVVRAAAEGEALAAAYRRLGDEPRIVAPAPGDDLLAGLRGALLRERPALVHCRADGVHEALAEWLDGTCIDLVADLATPALPADPQRLMSVARVCTPGRAASQALAARTGLDLPARPESEAAFARFVRAAERRVCCVLGGGIGNMIQNAPALRRLSEHLGLAVDLVLIQDYPDCATLFAGAPWIGGVYLADDLARSIRYDLAVVLDAFTVDLPTLNADATVSVLAALPRTTMRTVHEAEYYLMGLQRTLGIPYQPADVPLYFLGDAPRPAPVPRRVGIHAGCKPGIWAAKQWPFFAELIPELAAAGFETVCFGGPEEAVPGALDRTGLPLARTIAEIAACTYFVSNDSGLMHVADALGVPLTGLFGPSSVVKNRPLAATSQVVHVDRPCAPCQFERARLAQCTCIRTLGLAEVADAVRAHMRRLGLLLAGDIGSAPSLENLPACLDPAADLLVLADPGSPHPLPDPVGNAALVRLAFAADGFPAAEALAALAERLGARAQRLGIVVLSPRIAYPAAYLAALAHARDAGGGGDHAAGTVTYNSMRRAFQHAAGGAGARTRLACSALGCFSLDTLVSAHAASAGGSVRILAAPGPLALAGEAGAHLDHAAVEAVLNDEAVLTRAEHGAGFAAALAFYREDEPDRLRALATRDYPAERILADREAGRYAGRLVETLLRAGAVARAGALVAAALDGPEALLALSPADLEALVGAVWEVGAVDAFVAVLEPNLDAVLRRHPGLVLRLIDCAAAALEPERLGALILRAADTVLALDDPQTCLVLLNAASRHADPATLAALLGRIDASAYAEILREGPTYAGLHGRAWVMGLIGEALSQEPRARFSLPRTGLTEADFPAGAAPRRPMRRALVRAIRDGDRDAFVAEVDAVLRQRFGAQDLWRLLRSHTHAIRRLGLRDGDIAYGSGADDLALAVVLDDGAVLAEAAARERLTPELAVAWRSRRNDYGPLNAHLAALHGAAGLAATQVAGRDVAAVLRACLNHPPLPPAPDRGRVSVILCAHDPDPELLRLAVASVLGQTYRNLELIVVDDAGPRARRRDFRRIAAGDARVRLLRNPVNGGPYLGRNRALGVATGAFVAFQDADDVAHPQRLEAQIEALLRAPSCVATYAQHMRFDAEGGLQFEINPDRLNLHGDGPVTAVVRREALDAVGGFAPVRSRGDIDMRDRLEKCFGVAASLHLPLPLMFCSGGPASLSNTVFSHHQELVRVFRFGSRRHAWPPVQAGAFLFAPVGTQPVPFALRSTTPRAAPGRLASPAHEGAGAGPAMPRLWLRAGAQRALERPARWLRRLLAAASA